MVRMLAGAVCALGLAVGVPAAAAEVIASYTFAGTFTAATNYGADGATLAADLPGAPVDYTFRIDFGPKPAFGTIPGVAYALTFGGQDFSGALATMPISSVPLEYESFGSVARFHLATVGDFAPNVPGQELLALFLFFQFSPAALAGGLPPSIASEYLTAQSHGGLTISNGASGTSFGTGAARVGGAASAMLIVGQVAYAPEPATWAMMIAGFGAAGSMLRRRLSVSRSA